MSESANQQERKRKWNQDATEIAATPAAAAAAKSSSTSGNAPAANQTSIFYSLKPDVLELIGSFCEHQDCIQLRATCKPMKQAAGKSLYDRALAKFQTDKPIKVNRFFLRDDFGFISLAEDDGTFPSKDQFVEMCLEKIDSGSSEVARAREELLAKGVSMNYCDAEECYGSCYQCKGKFGRPKTSRYRKLDTTTNLKGMKTIMDAWMTVYNQFQDWHDSYLECCSHMRTPKEKIKTFDEFDSIRDILFGLYAGSSKTSECAFTTIEFRDYGRDYYNLNCTNHFALFPGRKGQKIVFNFGFRGFFEYYGLSGGNY